MMALGVVVAAPTLNEDLRLGEAVEDLPAEQLVAEHGIEVLAVAVLPEGSRLNVGSLCADGGDPLPHRLGDELLAIVRPDVNGNTAQDEQIGQEVDDVG
jgi:hypothetical protein